ncbi:hypothetical protein EJB05_34638, partial [Eragrostis curvula]
MAYGHWINILGVVNGHANLPNGENEVSCSLEQMRGDHDKSCCDGELKVEQEPMLTSSELDGCFQP